MVKKTRKIISIVAYLSVPVIPAVAVIAPAMPALAQSQSNFSPAAMVDGRVITNWDVDQRARILQLTGASEQEARGTALEELIGDRIKIEAARLRRIDATDQLINVNIGNFAQRLGMNTQQFERAIKQRGISVDALKYFIRSQVVWGEYIRRQYGTDATPSALEVDDAIKLRGLDMSETYALSELAIPWGNDRNATGQLATSLVSQLRGGADFAALARQYSRSGSASKGGSIGDVPENRLPPPLRSIISQLPDGGVSDPVPTQAGLIIFKLNKKTQTATEVTDEQRQQIAAMLEQEALDRVAVSRYQELRADSFVEYR